MAEGRIIPTRVGTSNVETYQTLPYEDHPHACGDKLWLFRCLMSMSGSSPRVWGQADFVLSYTDVAGIIPTRVGTSPYQISYRKTPRDHPHACGDKPVLNHLELVAHGSSPRVWGQAALALRGNKGVRIIPTRVGTSLAKHVCRSVCRDHPHACGDKPDSSKTPRPRSGSSPRVWGQV